LNIRCDILQAGLILPDFFLRDITLTQLENLHHFSNLHNNFWFNYWSLAALVLCWRLRESDVTVTPSVTCVDWWCWWYNHVGEVVPPSTYWLLLSKWVRNVNLHHLVQSKWKIDERQSVLKRN